MCWTGALEVWHQSIRSSHSEAADPVWWWAGPADAHRVSETNSCLAWGVIFLLWPAQTRGWQVKNTHSWVVSVTFPSDIFIMVIKLGLYVLWLVSSAQCIVVILGFLPFALKGKTTTLFPVFFDHLAQWTEGGSHAIQVQDEVWASESFAKDGGWLCFPDIVAGSPHSPRPVWWVGWGSGHTEGLVTARKAVSVEWAVLKPD